jgi:hypothetical protein
MPHGTVARLSIEKSILSWTSPATAYPLCVNDITYFQNSVRVPGTDTSTFMLIKVLYAHKPFDRYPNEYSFIHKRHIYRQLKASFENMISVVKYHFAAL